MASERPIDLVRRALGDRVKERSGRLRKFTAHCPVHDDKSPSLHVEETASGEVRCKCFACGAGTNAVFDALKLERKLQFPDLAGSHGGRKPTRKAEFNKGEKTFTKSATYDYLRADGTLAYHKDRWDCQGGKPGEKMYTYWRETPNKEKVWGLDGGWHEWNREYRRWERTGETDKEKPPSARALWIEAEPRVLYGLPQLLDAARSSKTVVWLPEGEKDVHALRRLGVVATTAPNGASEWRDSFTQQLADFGQVEIVADNDVPGLKGALAKREKLAAAGVACRILVAGECKDPWEWVVGRSGGLEGFVEIDAEAELASRGPVLELVDGGGEGRTDKDDWKPPLSDLDNAELFVRLHGDDLRWCEVYGKSLAWDGKVWAMDETGGSPVLGLWAPMVRDMKVRAKAIEDGDPMSPEGKAAAAWKSSALKWAKSSESAAKYHAMWGLAKYLKPLPITPDQFDTDRDMLPVANGLVDLRTGELGPFRKDLMLTHLVPVAYEREAGCANWLKFLDSVTDGDTEMKRLLWKAIGYSLTGHTKEQKFFFLHGAGQTGKTTFVETVTQLLGGWAKALDPKHLMEQSFDTIPEHFAALKGTRMVRAVEVMGKTRFNEGLMKRITGGETLRVRFLRENSFEYQPQFKLWLTGNERPYVSDTGDSFWRRMVAIPINREIPAEERDDDLPAKLQRELPGILAWAVAGAVAWRTEGLGTAERVEREKEEYREEVDILGRFLRDCTMEQDTGFATTDDLHKRYMKWAVIGGDPKITKIPFSRMLKGRRELRERYQKTNSSAGYRGMAVVWPPEVEDGA